MNAPDAVRQRKARPGSARRGRAGRAWQVWVPLVAAWQVVAWRGWLGRARHGWVRQRSAGRGAAGIARLRPARPGSAGQGAVRYGGLGIASSGEAWPSSARFVQARRGRRGAASCGWAGQGLARFGAAGVVLLAMFPASLDLPPEGIYGPATVEAAATRGTSVQVTETAPPPVEVLAPDGLSGCSEMSWYRQRAGLPARFDAIGWRESNCRQETGVRTSCCVGWLQLNVSLHLRDHRLTDAYHACGVWSYRDADGPDDKARQMCAAKALYDTVGMSAWATT